MQSGREKKLIEDIKYKAGTVGITANGIVEKLPQSTSDTYFYDVGTKDYTKISGIEIKQRDALIKAIQTKERRTIKVIRKRLKM